MSAIETPVRLEAHEPPEVRGRGRDDVALLVASRHDGRLVHAAFRDLPRFLAPGDLLVVNTSATLPAALPAGDLELRLSTWTEPGRWLVELRTAAGERFRGGREGDRIPLPEGQVAEGGVDEASVVAARNEERDVVAPAAAHLGRLVRLEADRGLDGAHPSSRAW